VLDVGCGDQYVSSALSAEGYLGLDISAAVITKNRALYPERRFKCVDFSAAGAAIPTSEAVVCLDVLIHLDTSETYQTFVQRLVEATERVGIVAGYEAAPEYQSDMIFFHEPLSETLRRYGAHSLQQVGGYSRDTVIWRFGTGDSPLEPIDLTGRSLMFSEAPDPEALFGLTNKRAQPLIEQQSLDQQRIITDQLRTIAAQDHQIAELLNSTSWKLTAPLRRIVTLTRHLKRKLSP
jgi:hypothetical protein